MHSPRVAAANAARAALQRLDDYYLRTICRLAPSTPRKLLLTELGLLPLQGFWWRQTLQSWNGLAGLPIGSLYHTVCLDNLTDAFQGGTDNLANSLTACLHSVGFEMPRVHGCGAPVGCRWCCGGSDRTLAEYRFENSGSLYRPRSAPTQGVVSCTYEQWFEPHRPRRGYCQLPVSGRQQHADLFTPRTQSDTMRSLFAQQDHLGVLKYVMDCLTM